jgi:hypothetical protein
MMMAENFPGLLLFVRKSCFANHGRKHSVSFALNINAKYKITCGGKSLFSGNYSFMYWWLCKANLF